MADSAPQNPAPPRRPSGWDRLWVGVLLTLPLHLFLLVIVAIIGGVACLFIPNSEGACLLVGFVPLFLFGGVQLVYMLPAIVVAFATGRRNLASGLVIGAAITFFLNAACWGLLAIPNIMGDMITSLPF